jgi:hypothetical protein
MGFLSKVLKAPLKLHKRANRAARRPLASKKNTIHSRGDINRVEVQRNPGNVRRQKR